MYRKIALRSCAMFTLMRLPGVCEQKTEVIVVLCHRRPPDLGLQNKKAPAPGARQIFLLRELKMP